MKQAFLVLILAALTSCTTSTEKRRILLNQIQTDMTSLNTTVRGELIRTTMKGDLSRLDALNYRQAAIQLAASSEKEYLDLIKDERTEITINSGKRKFAVCSKNVALRIVICDATESGATTDFDSEDMNIDIQNKVKEFPVN
ncbi:MAG: hypothetical protein V4654_12350 [Bdellovibrionota bacterium]